MGKGMSRQQGQWIPHEAEMQDFSHRSGWVKNLQSEKGKVVKKQFPEEFEFV